MKELEGRAQGDRKVRGRDRRECPRVRVRLPVSFGNTTGWTRDVSGAGVFFTLANRTAQLPEAGEQIRFGLVLEHADPSGLLKVRCKGSVVRVEHSADAVGVAVRFQSYQFDPTGITAS